MPGQAGLLPRQEIRALAEAGAIAAAAPFRDSQWQPASLDLRLGRRAYRVRASFLPGAAATVADKLDALRWEEIDLSRGAIFERGCVYVVELAERLALPADVSAAANPKSSTGRLDVFTRLIADRSETFDTAEAGYRGPLHAEVSPRTFSVKVREGTRLNQIRFRRGTPAERGPPLADDALRALHAASPLVAAGSELTVRNGLGLRIELAGFAAGGPVGFRAQRHADLIDLDRVGAYAAADHWEPILPRDDRRLILDPNEFYILASKERLHVPPAFAAEMAPIDPLMGEFRVHYAGFFDPGFGWGGAGSRAVMEVRSHEVPFAIEDGQLVCRLAFERMAAEPDALYGAIGTSNYQGQDLKLSKQFRAA